MQQADNPTTADAAGSSKVALGSNELRLSPRQWLAAMVLLVALFHFIPILWERIEPLGITPDYRIPFSLGNDYWSYQRWCGAACRDDKTLVLGDSVVWGHYVSSEQTLSHYLNELTGAERFANVGVDGIHPAAMTGLVESYGRAVAGKNVLLSCNLLWMSSKRHDLQEKKEFALNHPRLVPQFCPRIPCYGEKAPARVAIVVGREVPLFNWADHLRIAYFNNADLAHWVMDHPYENPAEAVTLELPSADEPPSPPPAAKPWTQQEGMAKSFKASWVEFDASLQWRCFRQTATMLRDRGNRVFVVVGPFNEHILQEKSLAVYRQRKNEVESWLEAQGIPCYVPPALPSECYADASHPLAEGYAMLAKQLFENDAFRRFDEASRKQKAAEKQVPQD